jgi:hypothetical protein
MTAVDGFSLPRTDGLGAARLAIVVWEKDHVASERRLPMQGSALRVEGRSAGRRHCTHCQSQSGSLSSFNLVVREADYEQSGETMICLDKR